MDTLQAIPQAPTSSPYRCLLPQHALAVCMALHKRLGRASSLNVLCVEVLRDHIFKDLLHLCVTLFFKNYKHSIDSAWKSISTPAMRALAGRSARDVFMARALDPSVHYLITPPTVHFVGRVLGVETKGMSRQLVRMREEWENFLRLVIGDLFHDYVILFQKGTSKGAVERSADYQAIVWESCEQRPVWGNDVVYIQGLIDGFFATWSKCIYHRGRGLIVVRQVEGSNVLQTFMFGKKVDREALLASSTLKGPLHSRTLLQSKGLGAEGGMSAGGWARLGRPGAFSRLPHRERVGFGDAVKKGVPLECVVE